MGIGKRIVRWDELHSFKSVRPASYLRPIGAARAAEPGPASLAHRVWAVGLYKNHRLLSPEALFRLIKKGRLTITGVRLYFDSYDYVLAH